jgi:hypothetical protein
MRPRTGRAVTSPPARSILCFSCFRRFGHKSAPFRRFSSSLSLLRARANLPAARATSKGEAAVSRAAAARELRRQPAAAGPRGARAAHRAAVRRKGAQQVPPEARRRAERRERAQRVEQAAVPPEPEAPERVALAAQAARAATPARAPSSATTSKTARRAHRPLRRGRCSAEARRRPSSTACIA